MMMLKMHGGRELALTTNNDVIADAEGFWPWKNECARGGRLVDDIDLQVSTVGLRGTARPVADLIINGLSKER